MVATAAAGSAEEPESVAEAQQPKQKRAGRKVKTA
jgi:hypothetical protein